MRQEKKEFWKCVDAYKYFFIFSMANMNNSKLKDICNTWKPSQMFFGKNKVTMVALGPSPSNEYKACISQQEWFTKYMEMDFAQAGNKATFTVTPRAVPPLHGASREEMAESKVAVKYMWDMQSRRFQANGR
ncbi:unnamed protein product [Nyctereutes procyonoides]|uniref:(raccoon dog) hypothetical protein n=1 Tax=Nyctereutes procyonoides TaxID=34880 RepID=A0A811ZQ64_NYCPR|nr:unnamed protein product [Nyctereutes procyonoides]